MRFREANEVIGRIKTPDDGYKALSAAIIATACDDYLRAVERRDTSMIKNVERFLLSERFIGLSDGINGAYILSRLKKMRREHEPYVMSRPVQRLDENGNVLEDYLSVFDATYAMHGDRRSITRACDNGKVCYGYYWRWKKEGD